MKTELELKVDTFKLKKDSHNSNFLLDIINGNVICPLVPRDKFYEDFTGVIVDHLTSARYLILRVHFTWFMQNNHESIRNIYKRNQNISEVLA
jgi:hypothetical protein